MIAVSTIVVPISTLMNTRPIVSPATISTRTTSESIGTGVRSSDSIADRITINPIFANSDGLICNRLTPGMSM